MSTYESIELAGMSYTAHEASVTAGVAGGYVCLQLCVSARHRAVAPRFLTAPASLVCCTLTQVAKTRHRVAEMKAALRVLQALHQGEAVPGLQLSYGADAGSFLRGRLDLSCVAAAGHRYKELLRCA